MFERATIFSALLVLIIFGVFADKYLDFAAAKDSVIPASANSSMNRNSN